MKDRKHIPATLHAPPRASTLRLIRADGSVVPVDRAAGVHGPATEAEPAERQLPPPVSNSPQAIKPWPDFPLTAHPRRGWIKKIRGKQMGFGPLNDPYGAHERYQEYLAEQDAAIAGSAKPTPERVDGVERENFAASGLHPEGLTVRHIANAFVNHHKHRVEAGELQARSFADYMRATEIMVRCFGASTPVALLGPPHFTELRAKLAEQTKSPAKLNQLLVRIRSLFSYAVMEGLLKHKPAYGVAFRKPPKSAERKRRAERGEQMFTAAEIHRLLEHANPVMRAILFLGINCGFGNTDISTLRDCHITKDGTLINFPRSKTGIERTIPLWPETAEALRIARASRPAASMPDLEDRVFLTRFGKEWVKTTVKAHPDRATPAVSANNAISAEFAKLGVRAKLARIGGGPGSRGFYALRHTFRTVADECHDRPAIDRIMGHENSNDVSTAYREKIEVRRLVVVTDRVRQWLFAPTANNRSEPVDAAEVVG
jgi:integrase